MKFLQSLYLDFFFKLNKPFFSSALHIDIGFELIAANLETFMYSNGPCLMASKIKSCLGDNFS